jgi:lipid-A-disaccharide synthase
VPKIAILAGEPSGDLIASQLMLYINSHFKDVEYIGIGGPMMNKAGLSSYFEYSHLSIRGIFQVLKHIPKLFFLRNKLINFFKEEKPDIFIGIDAPDFNLYIEEQLKNFGIPTFHYVAPSVWAWRKNRIYKIKKCVDHLFAVFPHELKVFKKSNMSISYVGHPLANKISFKDNKQRYRKKIGIQKSKKVIALLPGSRIGEVKWHIDLMFSTVLLLNNSLKNYSYLIPVNNKNNLEFINNCLRKYPISNIKLIIGHSEEVIGCSNFAIVTSGTATLETALLKKPMVIIYKGSFLSFLIWKFLRLIPSVGLPNILLGKNIVPELLQYNATPEKLSNKVMEILGDKVYQKKLSKNYLTLHKKLRKNTSELILKKLIKYLK